MQKFLAVLLVAGSASAVHATAASAQSEAEFVDAFSGEWRIHDETFAQGVQICRLNLRDEAAEGRYELEVQTCAGNLAEVSAWGIVEGQLALFAGEEVAATLGGTQRRLTGTTKSGNPVILDRGSDVPDGLQTALAASGCYYLGFTDRCATDADLSKPAAEADTPARVNVIVNLNVRAEARDDAAVIGVAPVNSCIATSTCLAASDGVWCRAEFGERAGWLRKLALRQNRWPIVTFLNQCQE